MKKIEKDGRTFFEFEPHEDAKREKFEAAVCCGEQKAFDQLMEAILFAYGKAVVVRQNAWRAIAEVLEVDLAEDSLKYNHLSNRIELIRGGGKE